MTSQLPDDAVTAAAIAVHKRRCNCAIPHREGWPGYSRLEYEYAEHALTAALPALTEHIRQQLTDRALEMGYSPDEVFTVALPHLGRVLADLLGGTADGADTPGGTT